MKQIFILLAASVLLSSCAAGSIWSDRPSRDSLRGGPSPEPFAASPMEAKAYLKKRVNPKTLADWDKHVSDDTLVVDVGGDGKGTVR